jgi:hypothetical protein
MKEGTTLQMVSLGTPPDYEDAIIEIRSPLGVKRITNERLTEITMESWRLGGRGKPWGSKALCAKHFDRMIEEEFARV